MATKIIDGFYYVESESDLSVTVSVLGAEPYSHHSNINEPTFPSAVEIVIVPVPEIGKVASVTFHEFIEVHRLMHNRISQAQKAFKILDAIATKPLRKYTDDDDYIQMNPSYGRG